MSLPAGAHLGPYEIVSHRDRCCGHRYSRRGDLWSIYPVDGGASEPVRGLQPSDTPVRWTQDGDSLVVLVHDEIPARLERVSLRDAGRLTLFSIVPTDRTGVVNIDAAEISGDEKYYAYNYRQIDASLFLIEGAK